MRDVTVSYREIAPRQRFHWRLNRGDDGTLRATLDGHPGVTVTRWFGDTDLACRCAGEETTMKTLHGAMSWCEENLYQPHP